MKDTDGEIEANEPEYVSSLENFEENDLCIFTFFTKWVVKYLMH